MSTQTQNSKSNGGHRKQAPNEGLAKLEGTRFNAFKVAPEKVILVGIDTEDRGHALYDERVELPLDEGLVLNVMAYGVLNPVIVRKNSAGLVEVVDGRQRVRAAREANKRLKAAGHPTIRIPVVLKGGESRDMAAVMVSLNECRQQDSVVVRAQKAQRMLDMGRSEDEVAVMFGVSAQTIKLNLSLLSLEPELLSAVKGGKISASEALKVAGRGTEAQKRVAEEARKAPPKKPGRKKGSVNAIPKRQVIDQKIDEIKGISPIAAVALGWAIGKCDEDFFMRALHNQT